MHFNFKRADEIFLKIHPIIIKIFCFIVLIWEIISALIFYITTSISYAEPFIWSIFFLCTLILGARLYFTLSIIKKTLPITVKEREQIVYSLFGLMITFLISNIFTIFSYYYSLNEIKNSFWSNLFFTLLTTSYTSYLAFVHSIQFFRPAKKKSLIVNIITAMMMLCLPLYYILKDYLASH